MSKNNVATRTNRFGSRCEDCNGWVPAGTGLLQGSRGNWVVRHRENECPPPKPKVERKNAEPGYYVTKDNAFVVVVRNKAKTATYAKRLNVSKTYDGKTKARWVYERGLGFQVADLTPMTLDEAANFGHLHGVCVICCRQLTDPESVKRGIGPVCATKVGAPRPTGMSKRAHERINQPALPDMPEVEEVRVPKVKGRRVREQLRNR